ncbi:galactokinase signature [Trichococcus palustris]|jgi:galactokinase|uniref:Galactokinase n=1 Tax=Trichococcus palustris TaxID=140314 RepID=A0A143YM75_9LACT|nr:galactokinase [Trichococcus palustris]CZQ90713.1 galactokinase signature [Trichococcus palustris]SFL17353.1 galactokinase [Trichococcus palustris]
MEMEQLKKKFEDLFGDADYRAFFAPGRINLIGEHTDYNGGNVFPCAITLGTYAVASKNDNNEIRLYSENFPDIGVITFDLTALDYKKEDVWANYSKGMLKYLKEAGHAIDSGLDMVIQGDIPNGSGLSSSASLELLTGVVLENLFDLKLDRLDLIQTGKRVENEFIGVNSGIMDQFAVGMGEKNKAILLDCNTLKYEMIPVELGNRAIVIMNTKKRRELVDSKYNERRSECEQALALLQTVVPISSLGELDEETFEKHKDVLNSDVLYRRARHAVTENQRTLRAATALKAGDLETFGKLMNQSHISLRDDYEVTGIELDTLAEIAWEQPGVLGARMTGAGFGGCGIAIVAKENISAFIENVGAVYEQKIGYPAAFYIAEISDGAKLMGGK